MTLGPVITRWRLMILMTLKADTLINCSLLNTILCCSKEGVKAKGVSASVLGLCCLMGRCGTYASTYSVASLAYHFAVCYKQPEAEYLRFSVSVK